MRTDSLNGWGLLVRERCLHDEQVYVLYVWEARRGYREVVLERDVPSVDPGRRVGLEEDARRPQNVTALGERNARVPDLYGLAERHGGEAPLYLAQGRSSG